MMYPPILEVCSADAGVQAVLGSDPCRVHLFGYGKGSSGGVPATPYAVWQIIGGIPENYLGSLPDADNWSLQIDVYASTAADARDAAMALRNAIEPVAYVVGWRGEGREPDTKLYRYSFDVDWITQREILS